MEGEGLNLIGRGLYRLSDVARYTSLPEPRIRSWFTTRSDRKLDSVFQADYATMDGAHVVSFLDMVDAWIAGQLRAEGVSMMKVRAAHLALKSDIGTAHPFAHSSIYTDGKEVFTDVAKQVNDSALTHVVSRQGFFPRVRKTLTPIEYSATSQMAERWNIAKGVLIDPRLSFGQPVVLGTGVATRVVAASFRANKRSADLVARLFGITRKDVGAAVRFEERYGHQAAA